MDDLSRFFVVPPTRIAVDEDDRFDIDWHQLDQARQCGGEPAMISYLAVLRTPVGPVRFTVLDRDQLAGVVGSETGDYDLESLKARLRQWGATIAVHTDDYCDLLDAELDEMMEAEGSEAQLDWMAAHGVRFRVWLPGERWPAGYLEPDITSWGG